MKIKRQNQKYTTQQNEILDMVFKQTQKPDKQTRVRLANLFFKPERSIQIWFQNKRARIITNNNKLLKPIQEIVFSIYEYDSFDFLNFLNE